MQTVLIKTWVAYGNSHLACVYINVYEDVPLMEFMYLVFTRTPCESYRRRLRSLLLIQHERPGPRFCFRFLLIHFFPKSAWSTATSRRCRFLMLCSRYFFQALLNSLCCQLQEAFQLLHNIVMSTRTSVGNVERCTSVIVKLKLCYPARFAPCSRLPVILRVTVFASLQFLSWRFPPLYLTLFSAQDGRSMAHFHCWL